MQEIVPYFRGIATHRDLVRVGRSRNRAATNVPNDLRGPIYVYTYVTAQISVGITICWCGMPPDLRTGIFRLIGF